MRSEFSKSQVNWVVIKVLVVILILSAFMAYLPQRASAACFGKYTVVSGDTLYKVAAKYSVTFNALAEANKLTAPYLIYVGEVLCIPEGAVNPESTVAGTTPGIKATVNPKGPAIIGLGNSDVMWLGVANFPKKSMYYVKVYPTSGRLYNYSYIRLGVITTDKNGKFGSWFHIPGPFRLTPELTVCLKDVWDDDVEACASFSNNTKWK